MLNERKLTKNELEQRQVALKGLFKDKRSLVKKYGKDTEKVMYGIATKHSKKKVENMNLENLRGMIQDTLKNPKKADLNKEGKISNYEKKHGAAVENNIKEDKFSEAAMADVFQSIKNLAHTTYMSEQEAAEKAIDEIRIEFNVDVLYESLNEQSLDDQAKIYWMQKIRRGEIDVLPKDPKAAFLAQMTKDQIDHDEETLKRERGLEERVAQIDALLDEKLDLKQQIKFFNSLKVGDKVKYNSVGKNGIKKGDEVVVDSIKSSSTFEKTFTVKKGNKKVIVKATNGLKPLNINEKFTSKSSTEDYIEDFTKSDAPQFKGKSKEDRIKMAVAAALSNKKSLKEYTDNTFSGAELISSIPPLDMFQKQAFEELFPQGVASEDEAIKSLQAHDKSGIKQRMGQYAPIFVHVQYHEFEDAAGEKYGLHQRQYYNSNFKDTDPDFNPSVTKLTLTKLADPNNPSPQSKEDIKLGSILVKTDEYFKDLKNLNVTKRLS